MGSLENKIKDFVSEQGVEVVGLAGPERLAGPPSLDPTYTLPGARSIVSIALPMDTDAIYDWLSRARNPTTNWTRYARTSVPTASARTWRITWYPWGIRPGRCRPTPTTAVL